MHSLQTIMEQKLYKIYKKNENLCDAHKHLSTRYAIFPSEFLQMWTKFEWLRQVRNVPVESVYFLHKNGIHGLLVNNWISGNGLFRIKFGMQLHINNDAIMRSTERLSSSVLTSKVNLRSTYMRELRPNKFIVDIHGDYCYEDGNYWLNNNKNFAK